MFCDKRCSPGTTPLNRADDVARERIFFIIRQFSRQVNRGRLTQGKPRTFSGLVAENYFRESF